MTNLEHDSRAEVGGRTSVGAAQQPRSHADLPMPVDRVKADEAGDKRGVEVVVALHVLVDIPAEFLPIIRAHTPHVTSRCEVV